MPLAKTLAASVKHWASGDIKLLILAVLGRLDLADLAEVLAAAHQRVHLAADKARDERLEAGRKKRR